jgi:hypothetical protein
MTILKALMGDHDSLPPGTLNSELNQRLLAHAENELHPNRIRIDLFEQIPLIGTWDSISLHVLNRFLLRYEGGHLIRYG